MLKKQCNTPKIDEQILLSKMCLGTAQLGIPYGIANVVGRPDRDSAFAILEAAHEGGIDCLDTGHAYGVSEEIIGLFMKKTGRKFKIVTKLPSLKVNKRIYLRAAFQQSLDRLQVSSLYACLVHDFKTHLVCPEVWECLKELRVDAKVEKIGFSIYSPDNCKLLLENKIIPDILQFPVSVLDTRFLPLLPEIKNKKVEVHARSIFLQGAVFLQEKELQGGLAGARKSVALLREIAGKRRERLASLCMRFVLSIPEVDRIVWGGETKSQVLENIAFCREGGVGRSLFAELLTLAVNKEEVVVPMLWNQRGRCTGESEL